MCLSRECVDQECRSCSRNSQQARRISFDLELRFCVIIGIRRGECVYRMMNLTVTKPADAITYSDIQQRHGSNAQISKPSPHLILNATRDLETGVLHIFISLMASVMTD